MKRHSQFSIITGHFGSGKTEFAINLSMKSNKLHKKTILVDLDIVNPFFRSSEVRGMLENQGIEVFAPNFANSNVNVPSLPADIFSVFNREDTHVIFDVGGDEDGARALAQYKEFFKHCDYRMYFVLNTKRPFASTEEGVIHLAKKIEEVSHLKLTDMVSNTNLSYETDIHCIEAGYGEALGFAKQLELPVTYVMVEETLMEELPDSMRDKAFSMNRYMKPLWEA